MPTRLAPLQRSHRLIRRNNLNPDKLGQDVLQDRCVNTIIGCGLDDVVRDDVDVVVEIIKANGGGQDDS